MRLFLSSDSMYCIAFSSRHNEENQAHQKKKDILCEKNVFFWQIHIQRALPSPPICGGKGGLQMSVIIWICRCFVEAVISVIVENALKVCLRAIKAVRKNRSSQASLKARKDRRHNSCPFALLQIAFSRRVQRNMQHKSIFRRSHFKDANMIKKPHSANLAH